MVPFSPILLLILMMGLAAGTVLPAPLHAESLPVPVGIRDDLPDDVRRDLSAQNARLTRAMYELLAQQQRYQDLCAPLSTIADPVNTHDCDNFRDELRAAIEQYKDNVQTFNQDIQIILESAEYRAMQHLRRGIQIFNSYYQGTGSGGPRLGLESALQEFTRAMTLDPALAEPHYYRGVIFDEKNDVVAAVNEYTVALQLDPKDYRAYTARGIARAKLGETVRAGSDFDAAIALAADPGAYYNRGKLRAMGGDCAGADADFDKATDLEARFRELSKHETACETP